MLREHRMWPEMCLLGNTGTNTTTLKGSTLRVQENEIEEKRENWKGLIECRQKSTGSRKNYTSKLTREVWCPWTTQRNHCIIFLLKTKLKSYILRPAYEGPAYYRKKEDRRYKNKEENAHQKNTRYSGLIPLWAAKQLFQVALKLFMTIKMHNTSIRGMQFWDTWVSGLEGTSKEFQRRIQL